MHIEIAERLRPYSHLPGIYFILPGTSYRLQVFPTCFKVEDLSGAAPRFMAQFTMNLQGPLRQFTVEQDLEKGLVRVWGESVAGFFRYHLKAFAEQPGLLIVIEKAPQQGVSFNCSGEWFLENSEPLQSKDQRVLAPLKTVKAAKQFAIPLIDRLSLGNHKSQDWELMRRRFNFAEIFPIWHRLGQLVPKQTAACNDGTLDLFNPCQQAIDAKAPEHILSRFEDLYLAGFEGGLSPRLVDGDFQGIISNPSQLIEGVSPLQLLTRGAELIRSLFLDCSNNSIILLPACPPSFHCGRLVNVVHGPLGVVSIEWTKKAIRCMSFIAASTQEITISSGDGQNRCRVRQSTKDRGFTYSLGSSLKVIAGQNYWFDNFIA